MVVFRGEGGVVVLEPVHHGAAGDDDGGKQGADAVLKGWRLDIKRGEINSYPESDRTPV